MRRATEFDEPLFVDIAPAGRRWELVIRQGALRWGPDPFGGSWLCLTRRGAERKARRLVGRIERDLA